MSWLASPHCLREDATVRCYFVNDGKIVEVRELPHHSLKEAVEVARTMFEASSHDGIELWSLTRRIYRQGRPARTPPPPKLTVERQRAA